MKALGRHILVEMYGCDRLILNDRDSVRNSMLKATLESGATILGDGTVALILDPAQLARSIEANRQTFF